MKNSTISVSTITTDNMGDKINSYYTILPRVNNKRGECLTLYRPVIDDCAEVKWLPFRVTYRLLVFVRFLTAISLAAP